MWRIIKMSNEADGYIRIPRNLDLIDDEDIPDTLNILRRSTRPEDSQLPQAMDYLTEVEGVHSGNGFATSSPDRLSNIQPEIPVISNTIHQPTKPVKEMPDWLKRCYRK
jgi:hypothetical protein